jgi:RNA polymerase sigma-70 factor, ECF subfamily
VVSHGEKGSKGCAEDRRAADLAGCPIHVSAEPDRDCARGVLTVSDDDGHHAVPMGSLERGRGGDQDPAARVLGDLLYVDTTKTPLSEADWVRLVESVAAGNQHALHVLFQRTHRVVFTLIVRITNNRESAEEVTLDVFHDVWRRAPQYDATAGSVVGWIMNQARSRAIDRLRFEQRKKRVQAPAEVPPSATRADDPHDAFDLREQGRLLRDALTQLTPDERQAIETAFFSELTYNEAAVRLNQPLGTIKTRIRSGLGKLRQALATAGTGR